MHILLSILRLLFRIPQPKVSRDAALASALKEAEIQSISVGEPRVFEQLRVWEVWLDENAKGSPVIVIDQLDGTVKEVRTLPR